MNQAVSNTVLFLLIILSVQNYVVARPNLNSRVKRMSDTHIADYDARIGLQKVKGLAITLPVTGGVIRDLQIIGRKRRSESRLLETLFNRSEEDQGDPGQNQYDEDDLTELLYDYSK